MHRLFTFVRIFKEYVVFIGLVLFSLALLSLNDNHQIRAIRTLTVGVIGFLQTAASSIPNVFQLQHENQVLRQLNVNLSDEVSRLREARLENDRLRALIGLKERSPFRMVAADVVGKNLQMLRNTITLNAGEAQGIKPDMPIISDAGLVGRVIATSANYSIGQIILNKDFRAGAKILRTRIDCIVAWAGGDDVFLKNVAKKQDVKVGDQVVTSEYSSLFPPGIVIGTVTGIKEGSGSLFKDVEVTPVADMSSLEQVFIILQMPDPEREALEQKISAGH
ncbi:MAG TPA: rod shape-determining protein MreC [Bacteroidota bacterium]|nr:rod shape-determining protein MreC [Bacteroidota bacterium]